MTYYNPQILSWPSTQINIQGPQTSKTSSYMWNTKTKTQLAPKSMEFVLPVDNKTPNVQIHNEKKYI